ncbi:MAG: multiprotein-bridging factor 1 family protein [Candidatus ainarchaeum sp.]|nr:multiprotein-bridging factor 1 family protein [Candidatus ainarchaeum sp.]
MADCEVCGEGVEAFVVLIEGAKLRVCRNCARGEKVLAAIAPPASPRPGKSQPAPQRAAMEMELVPDYAERIRKAREKMRIGADVLAEIVFETESFLRRVESGRARPSDALGKRLERELGIRLYEEAGSGGSASASDGRHGGGVTLGDLIVVKKSGKGGK